MKQAISLTLDEELLQKVKVLAEANQRSTSETINMLLEGVTSAKEKLNKNLPLTEADMNALGASQPFNIIDKTGLHFPVGSMRTVREHKDADGTVHQVIIEVDKGVPYKVVEKEVRRDSAYTAENIDTIANLADFDSEEKVLDAWREAKKITANKERTKAILNAQRLLSSAFSQSFESFEPFPTLEELKAKTMSDYERAEASKEWQFWLKASAEFPKFVERRINEAVKVQLEEDKAAVRAELAGKYAAQLKVVETALPHFKEVLAALSK
jgi:hypothetical protein